MTDWVQQAAGYPNLCYAPQEDVGPSASDLFGQCIFVDAPASALALSAELAAAARRAAYPLRDLALYAYESLYWNLTRQGSGVQYKMYSADDSTVKVFDQRDCIEVGMQSFF